MPWGEKKPVSFAKIVERWPSIREEIKNWIHVTGPLDPEWSAGFRQCLFCGAYFRTNYDALNHCVLNHVTARGLKKFSFDTYKEWTQARREQYASSAIINSTDPVTPFLCIFCSRRDGYETLRDHVLDEHGEDLERVAAGGRSQFR